MERNMVSEVRHEKNAKKRTCSRIQSIATEKGKATELQNQLWFCFDLVS